MRKLALAVAYLAGAIAVLWAAGALYFDLPAPAFLRCGAAVLWLLGVLVLWFFARPYLWTRLAVTLVFAGIVGWWLSLKPSNEANWQPDGAQLARAEISGDEVTLHNVRNCDYRTETDYAARWETRTVRLSQITGIDLAINYWGSPWMAHPIASFQFADAPSVCFSIETRKKVGQSYSAIGGLYRQFELIYIVADERDVIRVRTNYRHDEDVYLYRTTATPAQARERFHEYLRSLNQIHDYPRWYNAITTNCTTSIRDQYPSAERIPWDWRLLFNGKADELMFERHTITTVGLPFAELKRQTLINPAAQAANDAPDFSKRIRDRLPGFSACRSKPISCPPVSATGWMPAKAGNTKDPARFSSVGVSC